ncbi:MAG: TIGR03364 family FAD-dependent oxidoreductase [Caulobacteraceae bacterium]|nr:TIGR03364 family FAD-dependent oxidoreductase [Caulobacteraceae bacterium]
MSGTQGPFDLAVVGAGIVGLASAYAAARAGKHVVVLERDTRANRASIRNFGFVTVTGQPAGECWRRARRSREVWADVAPQAGIAVEHRGLVMTVRRSEAKAVAQAFLATQMGEGCQWLEPADLRRQFPDLPLPGEGAVFSPHELRVESRLAIPQLTAWLAERWGVVFRMGCAVREVAPPFIDTALGRIEAAAAVVCPGDDLVTLFPEAIVPHGLTRCRLSMLRLADPGFRLPAAVMSDLGLVRYGGYSALPEAGPLRARLEREQGDCLRHGIHLIVVQSADGSLVVGDSHHNHDTPAPFALAEVEDLMLGEFEAALGLPAPPVLERWTGTYASSPTETAIIQTPAPHVRLAQVTSGTGASTAFAIGEEIIGDLFDLPAGVFA